MTVLSFRALARALGLALLLLFVIVLVRTAWVCDDAYITFRTVENFARGHGLTWNIDERVQTYTHPLWLFMLVGAHAVSGEPYFSTLALSICLSVAAFLIVTRSAASSIEAALLGAMLLVFSKAFIDFSTSGLENPLAHVLLALFFAGYWRWHPADGWHLGALAVLVGLALVNRLDAGLLVLPALAIVWMERPTARRLAIIGAGLAPIVLWECFSLVYYGFPFPNTAYAKLDTGIRATALAAQGFAYLVDSLRSDPLMLTAIAAAIVAGFVFGGWRGRAVAAGLVIYLTYVVRVGGDFMSGRLLTPAFVAALCLLVRLPYRSVRAAWPVPLAAVAVISVLWPATWAAAAGRIPSDTTIPSSGIADERAQYYSLTGLLRPGGAFRTPRTPHWALAEAMRAAGQRVAVRDMVGFFGYAARGDIHIVDSLALGDPLLARLPAQAGWRIGHFSRRLPAGYVDSLRKGGNRIADPRLARYYDRLVTITRGPIWQKQRLVTVLRMNIGRYERDVESYVERSRTE